MSITVPQSAQYTSWYCSSSSLVWYGLLSRKFREAHEGQQPLPSLPLGFGLRRLACDIDLGHFLVRVEYLLGGDSVLDPLLLILTDYLTDEDNVFLFSEGDSVINNASNYVGLLVDWECHSFLPG